MTSDAETIRDDSAGVRRAVRAAQSKQIFPNTVMYTLATTGYVPFVLNLYESMKRVGIAEYLVVFTPNEAVQQELSARGLCSLSFGREELPKWGDWRTPDFADWGDWRTPEFAQIVALKFVAGIEILMSGKNALFVDGDIVFLRNPTDYLQDIISRSSAQMIAQYEEPKNIYNTGFWFARPHPAVIELFHEVRQSLMDRTYCDQTCLNELVCQKNRIKMEALDPELFACGNQFLGELSDAPESIDRSTRPFDFTSAYMLHFNYLVGKRAKIHAMKEHRSLFYPGLFETPELKRSVWKSLSGFVRRAT